MLRPPAVMGTSIVLVIALVAIANLSPRMQQSGDRGPAERPSSPAPTATPPDRVEASDTPEKTNPPTEPSKAPVETTERHVIHGSGSIGVTSGEVEQGERVGDTHAVFSGPSRRPAPSTP